jgi:hypothetical protein
MKTLFLAWLAPESRVWYPVGRLDVDIARHNFIYEYTNGALDAQAQDGFHPVSSFPELHRRYEASELFPLFQNRVIDSHRRGFAEYVQSLDMDENTVDPLAILSVTGGERQTDNFEVFPKLVKDAGNRFVCRFFLHGLRHCNELARERAFSLQPGEELRVSVELNNPATGLAVLLATEDYQIIGWSPRYLVKDLLQASTKYSELRAKVIRNNVLGTPLNRRVLIELSGALPQDYEPMSDNGFKTISANSAAH